jgi:hypothetical protein
MKVPQRVYWERGVRMRTEPPHHRGGQACCGPLNGGVISVRGLREVRNRSSRPLCSGSYPCRGRDARRVALAELFYCWAFAVVANVLRSAPLDGELMYPGGTCGFCVGLEQVAGVELVMGELRRERLLVAPAARRQWSLAMPALPAGRRGHGGRRGDTQPRCERADPGAHRTATDNQRPPHRADANHPAPARLGSSAPSGRNPEKLRPWTTG